MTERKMTHTLQVKMKKRMRGSTRLDVREEDVSQTAGGNERDE